MLVAATRAGTSAVTRRARGFPERIGVHGVASSWSVTSRRFAASLMEAKIKTGRIRSASDRRKWEEVLRNQLFPAFGSVRVDQMTHDDVERWFLLHAALITKDQLSPSVVSHAIPPPAHRTLS